VLRPDSQNARFGCEGVQRRRERPGLIEPSYTRTTYAACSGTVTDEEPVKDNVKKRAESSRSTLPSEPELWGRAAKTGVCASAGQRLGDYSGGRRGATDESPDSLLEGMRTPETILRVRRYPVDAETYG